MLKYYYYIQITKYIGFEALEKQIKEGVKEKRIGYVVQESGILRHGNEITKPNGEKIGIVTSGTFSPILKKAVGMAYVKTEFSKVKLNIYLLIMYIFRMEHLLQEF